MTRRGIQTVGLSRIAALTAAVAGMLAAYVTGAKAQSGRAAPGQWPMAGQNIFDTHFQVAEHVISPANASRLAPRWTLTTAGAVSATRPWTTARFTSRKYQVKGLIAGNGRQAFHQSVPAHTRGS